MRPRRSGLRGVVPAARSGLPIDDDVDIENGGWAGVLSLRLVNTGSVTAADAVEQQPPADVLARAQQLT